MTNLTLVYQVYRYHTVWIRATTCAIAVANVYYNQPLLAVGDRASAEGEVPAQALRDRVSVSKRYANASTVETSSSFTYPKLGNEDLQGNRINLPKIIAVLV